MGCYSSSVVDIFNMLFPSLQDAESKLVASSPNLGKLAQKSHSIHISHLFTIFHQAHEWTCCEKRDLGTLWMDPSATSFWAGKLQDFPTAIHTLHAQRPTSRRLYNVEASSRGRYTAWRRGSNWRETRICGYAKEGRSSPHTTPPHPTPSCVTWRRYESVEKRRVCGDAREGWFLAPPHPTPPETKKWCSAKMQKQSK